MSTGTTTRKSTPKVGDFFYTNWGYDQTNVDFYKVVGVTPSGKSVRLQRWSQVDLAANDSHNPHASVVPGEKPALVDQWPSHDELPEGWADMDYWDKQQYRKTVPAPVFLARLYPSGASDRWHVTAERQYAWLWDGAPKYKTGYGYGH